MDIKAEGCHNILCFWTGLKKVKDGEEEEDMLQYYCIVVTFNFAIALPIIEATSYPEGEKNTLATVYM